MLRLYFCSVYILTVCSPWISQNKIVSHWIRPYLKRRHTARWQCIGIACPQCRSSGRHGDCRPIEEAKRPLDQHSFLLLVQFSSLPQDACWHHHNGSNPWRIEVEKDKHLVNEPIVKTFLLQRGDLGYKHISTITFKLVYLNTIPSAPFPRWLLV
jgi:hypothetical protein